MHNNFALCTKAILSTWLVNVVTVDLPFVPVTAATLTCFGNAAAANPNSEKAGTPCKFQSALHESLRFPSAINITKKLYYGIFD